jgi:exosortase A-associated hydrolase 1
VRSLLSFSFDGATLGATLDAGGGPVGLVMVMGGTQSRIGSHRMYERLARSLAAGGISCLRFDRRGVGDSSGEDPGFEDSRPDLAAAIALLRRRCPRLERVYGFGLCDGATSLCLFGATAGLDGLVLANPWLVEAEAGEPPAAAVRYHYRQRLFSREGWKKIITLQVDLRKVVGGLSRIMRPQPVSSLAARTAASLSHQPLPCAAILCAGDATAIAANSEIKSSLFNGLIADIQIVESDSHTFARPGDADKLTAAVSQALARLAPA